MEQAFFLTVEWCKCGVRGIFCNTQGEAFAKEDTPHTREQAEEILGPFALILSPESILLTKAEIKQYNRFVPLEEYRSLYGIAVKDTEGHRKAVLFHKEAQDGSTT